MTWSLSDSTVTCSGSASSWMPPMIIDCTTVIQSLVGGNPAVGAEILGLPTRLENAVEQWIARPSPTSDFQSYTILRTQAGQSQLAYEKVGSQLYQPKGVTLVTPRRHKCLNLHHHLTPTQFTRLRKTNTNKHSCPFPQVLYNVCHLLEVLLARKLEIFLKPGFHSTPLC